MVTKSLDFLTSLSQNNNREWFESHRNDYNEARTGFEDLVNKLIAEISTFDGDIRDLTAKDCIFRIFRDVRFSKDKLPYKTNFGASVNKGGKKIHQAGYYIHLEPGGCFLAGGIYMPMPDLLKKLRSEVYFNLPEFSDIIHKKDFVELFGEVQGEKLSRVPQGFPADFEGGEYLKFKSYIAVHNFDPLQIPAKNLTGYIVKVFKALKPFNDFLNRAATDN